MGQTLIYRPVRAFGWPLFVGSIVVLGIGVMVLLMELAGGQDSLHEFIVYGAILSVIATATLALVFRQIRSNEITTNEAGITLQGCSVPWESIRGVSSQESSGGIADVLSGLFPRRFPAVTLVVEYAMDGGEKRLQLPAIGDWQRLEEVLRTNAKYISTIGDTTEGKGHDWKLDRQQINDALASLPATSAQSTGSANGVCDVKWSGLIPLSSSASTLAPTATVESGRFTMCGCMCGDPSRRIAEICRVFPTSALRETSDLECCFAVT